MCLGETCCLTSMTHDTVRFSPSCLSHPFSVLFPGPSSSGPPNVSFPGLHPGPLHLLYTLCLEALTAACDGYDYQYVKDAHSQTLALAHIQN